MGNSGTSGSAFQTNKNNTAPDISNTSLIRRGESLSPDRNKSQYHHRSKSSMESNSQNSSHGQIPERVDAEQMLLPLQIADEGVSKGKETNISRSKTSVSNEETRLRGYGQLSPILPSQSTSHGIALRSNANTKSPSISSKPSNASSLGKVSKNSDSQHNSTVSTHSKSVREQRSSQQSSRDNSGNLSNLGSSRSMKEKHLTMSTTRRGNTGSSNNSEIMNLPDGSSNNNNNSNKSLSRTNERIIQVKTTVLDSNKEENSD